MAFKKTMAELAEIEAEDENLIEGMFHGIKKVIGRSDGADASILFAALNLYLWRRGETMEWTDSDLAFIQCLDQLFPAEVNTEEKK